MNQNTSFFRTYVDRFSTAADLRRGLDADSLNQISMKILDNLFSRETCNLKELIAAMKTELQSTRNPSSNEHAESIARWMHDRMGADGAIQAYELRDWLMQNHRACPGAVFNFARQKLLGEGCAKDEIFAHLLFEKVCDIASDPVLEEMALIECAFHWIDGRGVDADPERALELLIKAERLGMNDGAFNLALFYANKFGPIPESMVNFNVAAHFYARAAKGGCLMAQTNLGLLHLLKTFESANDQIGWSLLNDSIERGDTVALETITRLGLKEIKRSNPQTPLH